MRLLLLVVAWHYQLAYLLAERSPQECDDLRPGAEGIGAECGGGGAAGHAPVGCPIDGLGIIRTGRHIPEGSPRLNLRVSP